MEESQRLLSRTEHPSYKGGVGNDILHGPLEYKDSYAAPESWNPTLNMYIKQSEYIMSIGKILSGALCILLEKQLFSKLDDHFRVPIYMLIGSSLSFVIVYAVFDIIEIIKTLYHQVILRRSQRSYTPAILTNLLYLVMICMSCFMGGGLGIVYGIADIEGLFEESLRLVYFETFSQIMSLTPVGLVIGLFFGFLYGLLRAVELHYRGELPVDLEEHNKPDL